MGLTQFYFNLLILKTTHFHTQLITQLQPFFLSPPKKKNETRYSVYFTVTHLSHQRKQKRDREKERSRERGGEGWWRSSVAGRTKPAEIGVHQAAAHRPPPTTGLGQIGLTFFFSSYFLVLIQLCCYNKK